MIFWRAFLAANVTADGTIAVDDEEIKEATGFLGGLRFRFLSIGTPSRQHWCLHDDLSPQTCLQISYPSFSLDCRCESETCGCWRERGVAVTVWAISVSEARTCSQNDESSSRIRSIESLLVALSVEILSGKGRTDFSMSVPAKK